MLATSVTGPTPVGATWITANGRPSFWSSLLGFKSGSIGEVCILALILGGCYLIYRKTIDWRIPVGIIGAFLVIMLITWNHPLTQLLGGGIWLGAFYMATDWTTSPMTRRGKWIYAIGIGVFIALIRLVSPLPEGVAISILIWNVCTLVIDRYVAEPKFGEVKKPWFNKLPVFPKPKPVVAEPKPVENKA
jgi:electron transport complex protein RnfD